MNAEKRSFTLNHLAANLTGALITLLLCTVSLLYAHTQHMKRFELESMHYGEQAHHNLELAKQALNNLAQQFSSMRQPDASEFQSYARESIRQNASILAMAYFPRVREAERKTFNSIMRKEGYADFYLGRNHIALPESSTLDLLPLQHIEPFNVKNAMAIGSNILVKPGIYSRITQAVQTSSMQAYMGKIHAEKEDGYWVFLPLFTSNVSESASRLLWQRFSGIVAVQVDLNQLITDQLTDSQAFITVKGPVLNSNSGTLLSLSTQTSHVIDVPGEQLKLTVRHQISLLDYTIALSIALVIGLLVTKVLRTVAQTQNIRTKNMLSKQEAAERLVEAKSRNLDNALADLKTSLELTNRIVNSINDGVLLIDTQGQVVQINQRFADIWNLPTNVLKHADQGILASHIRDQLANGENFAEALRKSVEGPESTGQLKLNNGRMLRYRSQPFLDNGEFKGRLWCFHDISDFVSMESALEEKEVHLKHLERHDVLTRLPNRRYFIELIRENTRRKPCFALLFIDLKGFRAINDRLGHEIGDKALKVIADRFHSCLGSDDVLARLGGDEFAAIVDIESINDLQSAETITEQIIQNTRQPILIDGYQLQVTANVNTSVYPLDGHSAETLLNKVDTSIAASTLYCPPELENAADNQSQLRDRLNHALDNNGLELMYQPQVDLEKGKATSLEALISWEDEKLGRLKADTFVSMAGSRHMMEKLGTWVLRTACRQIVSWRRFGYVLDRISINMASDQLFQKSFPEQLQDILKETGCPANALELELSETQVPNNDVRRLAILERLREIGVHLALDNFGSGNTSLHELRCLPIQHIKIDRTLIRDVPNDEDSNAIVKAIVDLGHSLGLKITAKGVETIEQHEFIGSAGIDRAQGFHYAYPMDKDNVELTLSTKEESGIVLFPKIKNSA